MVYSLFVLIAVFVGHSAMAQITDTLQSMRFQLAKEGPPAGEGDGGIGLPQHHVYQLLNPSPGQKYTLRSGELFSFGNPMAVRNAFNFAQPDSTQRISIPGGATFNGIPLGVLLDQIRKFTLVPKDYILERHELVNPGY